VQYILSSAGTRRVATARAEQSESGTDRVEFGAPVMNDMIVKGKPVNAKQLPEQMFAPQCKPSLRWLIQRACKGNAAAAMELARLASESTVYLNRILKTKPELFREPARVRRAFSMKVTDVESGGTPASKKRPQPANVTERLQVCMGNLCLRFRSLKTGTEVCCQFCFIRILIKKHKHPCKGQWLRLLQCAPFIYRTMKFICWLISKIGAGDGNRTHV
jgi:hypothetical protein